MVYTTKIQGITLTSNVDPNQPQPPKSHYVYDIHFSVPFVNYIADWESQQIAWAANLTSSLASGGHTISHVAFSAPDNTTLRVEFDASSPPVLVAIAVILGIIAVITWLVSGIVATVTGAIVPPQPYGAWVWTAIILVIVGIAALLILTNWKKFKEAVNYVGSEAKGGYESGKRYISSLRAQNSESEEA